MLLAMFQSDPDAGQPLRPRSFRALADQTAQLARLLARMLDREPGLMATVTGESAQETEILTRTQMATQVALLWVFALRCDRGVRTESLLHDAERSARATCRAATLDELARVCQESREVNECVGRIQAVLENEPLVNRPNVPSTPIHLAYWFEQLWAQLDRHLRRGRGGYFTPWPLVQYVVRSVDHALRQDMGMVKGLATDAGQLRIVDPACGSGAFLLGVLEHLRERERSARTAAECDSLFRDTVADRLCGADLLPACCGAAEILLEAESGWNWSALRTSLLEDVETSSRLFAGRIPVIIGNPPYANFGRHNRGSWIREQLRSYTQGLGERKHNLNDDFIKFLRWGHYWIEQAGAGILAMVTSNTYLDGLTHRAMRDSLADKFDFIDVLDLHGNRKIREKTPLGARDENVFGIQQGVAISLFVRAPDSQRRRTPGVRYAELWGSAEQKLRDLRRTDEAAFDWRLLQRDERGQEFVPVHREHRADYEGWPRLDEIFRQYVSGVQTKWDAHFVGFTRDEVETRMRAFLADAARHRFPTRMPAWLARRTNGVTYDAECLRPYMVAPWDVRWVYYEPRLLGRARAGLLRNLNSDNPALVFLRQCDKTAPYDHLLVTTTLVSDRVFYNAHGAPFVAPLGTLEQGSFAANLQPAYCQALQDRTGMEWLEAGAKPSTFGARDVLHWVYARLWSPRYRARYRVELGRDFPRVPWPVDADEFRDVCAAGQTLTDLHCQLAADLYASIPSALCGEQEANWPAGTLGAGFPRRTNDGTVWLDRGCRWCEPLEEENWQFRLGGYAVLPRWLKQRRGRALNALDQQRWKRLVQTIRDTRRWLETIDSLLDRRSDQSTA
jgi:hypothetical protein